MWHEKAQEMPEAIKANIESKLGEKVESFWQMQFGGAHDLNLTLNKQEGDVWTALLWDDTCNQETARYIGTAEQVQSLVDTTVAWYASKGIYPVDLPADAWA